MAGKASPARGRVSAGRPAGKSASASNSSSGLPAKLAKLGIRRDFDLVLHLPLRYEDETRLTPIADAAPETPVQVQGRVVETEVVYRPRRQLVSRLEDETGSVHLRFFNFYPSQAKMLSKGALVRAFGEIRSGFFGGEMIHPRFHLVRGVEPLPKALTPIYPATAGLNQATLRTLIERALGSTTLEETVPQPLLAPLELPSFAAAVDALHHPRPDSDALALQQRTHPAWRRMKFDELLAQQLSMRAHYRRRRALVAPGLNDHGTLTRELLKRLPFKLTAAQQRAWNDIAADLKAVHPMHRLLQGDVGSGKTVVAALAVLRAVENGLQAAVMAPTEILAEQHYRKFHDWLSPLGVGLAWLSGSQTRPERKAALASIASGEASVVIGTHALFQDKVSIDKLGLVIVDEQHRFGVAQRLALRGKGDASVEAHQLMMSATPIPRTLSMSYYADLDVSVIDELPPGRKPVLTKLVAASRRIEVLRRVRAACDAGRQAYWVCPLIEESETLQLQTAVDTHARLQAEFSDLKVGLVHGRLPPVEKAAVMQRFAAGEIQLLVATTVIEVGVDVANASLMVIEHAERFGLAQLHQLRGRVGRGASESACVLLYENPLSQGARERLKVIYREADGFAIAAADLELRGPGEYLGARQSGAPLLRFADLSLDEDLVQAARAVAETMLDAHAEAAQAHMDRWLGGRADFLRA
jgi:ATP-dependent DNA helicase RecG